jgi:hypothetical protein
MVDGRILEALIHEVREQIKHHMETVSYGGCENIGDYKHLCGRLSAYREVLAVHDELEKKILAE